jgi:LmbE family N-acetylglucosaminyl deacetylase
LEPWVLSAADQIITEPATSCPNADVSTWYNDNLELLSVPNTYFQKLFKGTCRVTGMEETLPIVILFRTLRRWLQQSAQLAARSRRAQTGYALVALIVLVATTLLWSILGARLQFHNADQLSDAYLFSNGRTFHSAVFPGAHTFLLKWPIFWLTSLAGNTPHALTVATVGVVLVTVLSLAALLYRIDRRPAVHGTAWLCLSLALLLVPPQPYAGALLPVNMAMLTTRNLEYVVYIVALICFIRASRLRSWFFAAGVAVMALLIASDKLFLSLSAGGALMALIAYALANNWGYVSYAARWLMGTIAATATSAAALALLGASHVTHILNGASANPYGLAHGVKDFALGVAYGVTGLFTNTGANPAYSNLVLVHLPSDVLHGFLSWRGPAYAVALLLTIGAIWLTTPLILSSLKAAPRTPTVSRSTLLALTLLWSSAAALVVFVASNHYYPVDSRYLTIGLFALAVSAVVALRNRPGNWPLPLLHSSAALLLVVVLAAGVNYSVYHQQSIALQTLDSRNSTVVSVLQQHKVDVLVGDYWRVLPVKAASQGKLNAMPLAACTQPNSVLTSGVWQPDLTKHSFAYLLSFDGNTTNFPHCSLTDITAQYGRPQSTQLIAGSIDHPGELLLFYDLGAHKPSSAVHAVSQASLAPVSVQDMPNVRCDGPTAMNVVAHEDDDVLFMDPDLQHDIQAGKCVRSVYLTAGDAGASKLYWISRQLGAEASYGAMLGLQKAVWDQQTVRLGAGRYVTVASPHGNSKISLIFFGLPDGNLQGEGFESQQDQSLTKLYGGRIGTMQSVDGQSSFSAQQLVGDLSRLMGAYEPAYVRTQADVPSAMYPDHSDHIATGKFAAEAVSTYDSEHFGNSVAIPVLRYIGYPVHGYAQNVAGDDLVQKENAFLAYAQYDGGVCHTVAQCNRTPTYGSYIPRQYTENSKP